MSSILISDKTDFITKTLKRKKDQVKRSIQEEDWTIAKAYAPNARVPDDIRQMLTPIKGNMDCNTMIGGQQHPTLISKQQSYSIDQMNLVYIYKTFHPTVAEYPLFSSEQGTFFG